MSSGLEVRQLDPPDNHAARSVLPIDQDIVGLDICSSIISHHYSRRTHTQVAWFFLTAVDDVLVMQRRKAAQRVPEDPLGERARQVPLG